MSIPMIDIIHSLPSDQGAETALISLGMNFPEIILPVVQSGFSPESFHNEANGTIWAALVALSDTPAPTDLGTIIVHLGKNLESAGGPGRIAELYTIGASPNYWKHYAERITEKARRRSIIAAATDMTSGAMMDEKSTEELLTDAEAIIHSLHQQSRHVCEIHPAKRYISQALDHIQHVGNNPHQLDGLATGIKALDEMTRGLRAGELIIVGARPGTGKTALASCIAENVVIGEIPTSTLFVTCEMSGQQLMERMICSRSGVSMLSIRQNGLSVKDSRAFKATALQIYRAPLHILEGRGLSVQQLRGMLRRENRKAQIGLIIVDYLALLSSSTKTAKATREREVAEVCIELKSAALELGAPVLALAQLNREVDQRTAVGKPNSKPKISDLRESGQIEAEADLVAMIHRPSAGGAPMPTDYEPRDHNRRTYSTEEKEIAWTQEASLIVHKNRHGETGEIPMKWNGAITRFENL